MAIARIGSRRGRRADLRHWAGAGLLALALAGCDGLPPRASPVPPARPAGLAAPPEIAAAPSPAATARARRYAALQADLLTRGLLRTDGGGPDTPYSADDLVRNFEAIAFYDEYTGRALPRRGGRAGSGKLTRWQAPVRIGVEFGPSVAAAQARRDAAAIGAYARRLARITAHPVAAAQSGANFHVFIAGQDDGPFLAGRIRQLIPQIGARELALFTDMPEQFFCLLVTLPAPGAPDVIARAVALIPAEHPDLIRLSCVHEEIAQGLGLPNDSPAARPSIFNDDDEFALLTSHDEMLLRMLYDPRLRPGMTAAEALPAARIIARELMGQAL